MVDCSQLERHRAKAVVELSEGPGFCASVVSRAWRAAIDGTHSVIDAMTTASTGPTNATHECRMARKRPQNQSVQTAIMGSDSPLTNVVEHMDQKPIQQPNQFPRERL